MFDDVRNCSSNAHQVCFEDGPTKGDHCQSDNLGFHSRSQVRLKLDYFLTCNISDNITFLRYYIQTWHAGILMDAIYGDLVLDARSLWVGKCRKISVVCSRQLSKQ